MGIGKGFTTTAPTRFAASRRRTASSNSRLRAVPVLPGEFDPHPILQAASNLLADASASTDADFATGVTATADAMLQQSSAAAASPAPPEAGGISYSRASYYAVLALYAMSFPGVWSTVTRSTKAKIRRKTYVSPGENSPSTGGEGEKGGKSLRQEAGEIMACKYWRRLGANICFYCGLRLELTDCFHRSFLRRLVRS